MKTLLVFAMSIAMGVTSMADTQKTWDQIADEIESLPEGSTYNFPEGAYIVTRAIKLKSNVMIILPSPMYIGEDEDAFNELKRYKISVLNKLGSYMWELEPGAHGIYVGTLPSTFEIDKRGSK